MNDKELFELYMQKVESLKDDRFSLMSKDMFHGQNSYLRLKFAGSSIFNPEWIRRIEDCLYELGQIVNNPREVTTQEGAVMPIELAKKINYESVQHLASHSQYIKEIKENGDIVPSKILGIYNKDEIHTYENRFIATFIRRLVLFVEKRYEFIKETVNLNEKEIMYVKNKSIVDGQEVEVETKITVTREKQDDLAIKAREYIARIEDMKQYITYYYNSPFMKEFKTEKDVRKPILLTNIIRKNPLYHKCYETFLFIEKFDSLGVAFKVDRNWEAFNEKERKDLNYILLSNLLFLKNTENKRAYKKFEKVYKPKLLSSIDDESFLYGDLVKGPVEFVRCDEHYINYLKDLAPKDLPIHPNKVEKEYYKDEYEEKKALQRTIKEIESLLARIRREIARFEKKVEKLLEERKLEEALEAQKKLDELKAKEKSLLDEKREAIIRAAKEENVQPEEEQKVEEPVVEEQPVQEEAPVEEEKPEEVAEEPQEEPQPELEPEPEPEPEPVVEEEPQEEPVEEAKEEEPVEEQPQKEEPAPVEEQPVEEEVPEQEEQLEAPVEEEPVQEETPVEEPEPQPEEQVEEIAPEEPVEEEKPEEQPAPVLDEPQEEEQPEEVKEEQPQEENKEKAKKPRKKRKKAAKVAPKEEQPVEQEPVKEEPTPEPQPEPEPEPQPEPEPVPEPVPVVEEPAPKEAKKRAPKKKKAPKVKPAPVPVKKESKEKKQPKPAPKKEKEKPEVIPGKFIVKTMEGYYVNQKRLSDSKNEAKIFDDFNEANSIKAKLGGKVVKL